MSTQATVRYLTKTDAAHWFRRSERSLSRDIINAIKSPDQDMLQHVRLRLEDGSVRPGTDISIEEIIRLRDEGQNPTWEVAVAWLEARYGRRGDTPREEAEADGPPPPVAGPSGAPSAGTRELPNDPKLRLAVLEALNVELETRIKEKNDHILQLNTELDRRAEERREENELQKQNNVLMQQIYNLLSDMQPSSGEAGGLLAARRAKLLPATAGVAQEKPGPVEADSVQDSELTAPRQQGSRVAPKPARKKKLATPKRKKQTKKSTASTRVKQDRAAKKPASKHFPTLDRIARSLFGR